MCISPRIAFGPNFCLQACLLHWNVCWAEFAPHSVVCGGRARRSNDSDFLPYCPSIGRKELGVIVHCEFGKYSPEREFDCDFQGINRINALQSHPQSSFPLPFFEVVESCKGVSCLCNMRRVMRNSFGVHRKSRRVPFRSRSYYLDCLLPSEGQPSSKGHSQVSSRWYAARSSLV